MKAKLTILAAPLAYVVLGLILLIRPTSAANFLFSAVGILLLLYGGATVARFFVQGSGGGFAWQVDLVLALAAAVVGGLLLIHPSFLMDFVFIILGIYVLADGLVNLKRGLDLRKGGCANWNVTLITSVISVLLGLLILWRQGHVAETLLLRIIGASFLYEGVVDLVSLHALDSLFRE